MTINFPTASELEQGLAIQIAEDHARAANPAPRELRDQDLDRLPPARPKSYCPDCGKVFDYATKGVSIMLMRKHRKTAHPDTAEAY